MCELQRPESSQYSVKYLMSLFIVHIQMLIQTGAWVHMNEQSKQWHAEDTPVYLHLLSFVQLCATGEKESETQIFF